MHAFVTPVLLRLARLDSLRRDAKLDPPDRKPREASDRARGERAAIVRAHAQRQTVLTKRRFERALYGLEPFPIHRFASKQVATEAVGNRERVAVLLTNAEAPFEVRAPGDVRGGACRQRL